MWLNEVLSDRNNGLTQARLILAWFVLIDHAFALNGYQPLETHRSLISLSEIAVLLFIFLSGMLCYRSAINNNTNIYFALRLKRIMPGYWTCLLITGLLFMPAFMVLHQTGQDSWSQLPKTALEYWVKNLLLSQGEFAPTGWLSGLKFQALNGSLWTLQPEFMGYVVIALSLPLFRRWPRLLAGTFAAVNCGSAFQPDLFRKLLRLFLGSYGFELGTASHLNLAVFLLSGMLYYQYSERIKLDRKLGLLALAIMLSCGWLNSTLFRLILPLLLPYAFMVACKTIPWPWTSKSGDLSYGVYLYSFPIQQLIVAWTIKTQTPLNISLQILIASIAVLPFAWMSWHWIEQPFLRRARS